MNRKQKPKSLYLYKPGDPRNPAPRKRAAAKKRKAANKAKKTLTPRKYKKKCVTKQAKKLPEKLSPIPLDPPKKFRLGKSRREISARAKLIIQEIVNGADEKSALKAAGYSDSRITTDRNSILRSPVMQRAFKGILDEAGVTDDRIADKIASLMDARETRFFAHQGEIINEKQVDALSIQAEMVQFAAKLRGHVIDRSASLNVTVTLTDRLKSARERLQSKPVEVKNQ